MKSQSNIHFHSRAFEQEAKKIIADMDGKAKALVLAEKEIFGTKYGSKEMMDLEAIILRNRMIDGLTTEISMQLAGLR
jgi:hypothetical protein